MALGAFDIESLRSLGITLLGPEDQLKILGIFFNASKEASLIENNHIQKISEIHNIVTSIFTFCYDLPRLSSGIIPVYCTAFHPIFHYDVTAWQQ